MRSVKSSRSAQQLRAKIDEIDAELVELLSERLKTAREIGAAKRAESKKSGKSKPSIWISEREEEIYRKLRRVAENKNLPWPLVQAVFADVLGLCRAAQGTITAHVLGPVGTHSEWAARARFGEAAVIKHHPTIPRAIKAAEQAVSGGDLDAVAVVPLENSLEGSVNATVDSLVTTNLRMTGEGYYRVRHALLTKEAGVSSIKTVYSHPMGFAQCNRWLQENLAHAARIEVSSTAEAARLASQGAKGVAAIASPYLEGDKLRSLATDIQDSVDNTTRFAVLGARLPEATGDDKTSLVFSLPNKSGSLVSAIETFTSAKINMTKIESRPHRGLQWEYLFYVDLDGHAFEGKVRKALESFDSKVRSFKILGTYPKGRVWN